MLFYTVLYGTKFATMGQLKAKICIFCRYTPILFLYFSLISHVSINIHEKLNLLCYELDHFGKHAVSKH